MQPNTLPPGQRLSTQFPRFGLGRFARRFPDNLDAPRLRIHGDVARELSVEAEWNRLPRISQASDFHCVTTWSRLGEQWAGYRFGDCLAQLIVPLAEPAADAQWVVFHGQDGYRCALLLEDLQAHDVMLADHLNGAPLGLDHGGPLRLVAPAHYGYKNVKHLCAIEFLRDARRYRFPQPYPRFMDHPRARVAFEERGRWFPGWLLRWLYRPLIPFTVRNFARASAEWRSRRQA